MKDIKFVEDNPIKKIILVKEDGTEEIVEKGMVMKYNKSKTDINFVNLSKMELLKVAREMGMM